MIPTMEIPERPPSVVGGEPLKESGEEVWEEYLQVARKEADIFGNYSATTMNGLLTFVRITCPCDSHR